MPRARGGGADSVPLPDFLHSSKAATDIDAKRYAAFKFLRSQLQFQEKIRRKVFEKMAL